MQPKYKQLGAVKQHLQQDKQKHATKLQNKKKELAMCQLFFFMWIRELLRKQLHRETMLLRHLLLHL